MKHLISSIIICLFLSATASAGNYSTSVSLGWDMGIRGGFEYRFNRFMGARSDLGISFLGIAIVDVLGVVYFLPEESSFEINLLLGVPNLFALLTFEACMISFGGSLFLGYKTKNNNVWYIRAGEAYPLFFEKDKEMIRDIHFPFDLWPDLAIGVKFLF